MKMKCLWIRQLLSIILCLAMLFANVPPVFAEGTVTLSSPVTVNKGNLSTYQNAVLTTNGTAKPEDSLLVFDGVKVTVVLENFKVQINAPAGHTCQSGITLKNGADVTLILRGENLAQGKYGGAGIEVPAGCKLTISSQSTGSLEAIGGSLYGGGSGIGARGNDYNYYYPENTQEVTCGDIVINGGTIRAVGATMVHQTSVIGSAAGIGGSWLSTGGTVTINGGTVNATGGNFSPGIGAGATSILERITITGGVINSATTGSLPRDRKAAGLGAGVNSDMQTKTGVKNITITGGTIHVTGHLGLSDQSPNTVGYLDCNMQLSEDVDLTVSEKINPLGNMFQPVFSFRLEDLSIFQSVAGQLRVSDGTGNAVVEQSITLNKSGDGIFTCNISKLLYSERKGGAYNLALTVNGTTYTESFTLAESNSFTFGPGMGTAELVFRSNYLEKTLENVTVAVKDLATGQNVADAMVSGERKITCVGPTHGVMTLKLTPGKYVVTVTAPELNGGQPMEKEITVTKGETTTAYMLNENVVEIPEQLVLDNGNIVFGIEQDIPFLSYYNDNKEQKKIYNYPETLEYVILQKSASAIGNTITVNHGHVRMKLQGLNVSAGVPVAIQKGTAAAIKLDGTNTLTGTSGPGIHVAEDAALTLDGIGSLTVSGTDGAGIGGKHNENNGTITINGGTINATGDQFCAGIGTGGGNNDKGGRGGKITVNGGTVTAHGGRDGAGVGTGFKGSCAIEINGGSVNGTGRENSAGIGAGEYGTVTINITGGKAEGQGAERAAGIGSAYHSGASAINISGGTVIGKAWPEQGDEGAGIGGGNNADTMIITITGGTVEGYGGDAASGIGSGSNCIRPAKVYIRDGDVKGYGRQRYAAGIGGGGDGAVVEISGGTVLAEAWNYAAGIGGGDSKHAGTILISGGHVTAIGPAWDGAAIGSYIDAVGGSITITGGTVVATNDTSNVPAIGGANTITISGGTVTATADRGGAGIGGAAEQPSGTINISGGVITASSADEGAGIGAGYKGTLGEINISGGIITATGGFAAAGIGGGWRSTGGTINISGGTITATGDYNGAGIGGGYASGDMQIVITGGNIKATAGTNAQAVGNGGSATGMATVTNGIENVLLNTIILQPVPSDGKIKSITGIPGYYGLKDMQVLDNNRIYLYLPTNTTITAVQAGDETFEGSVNGVGTLTGHIHNWSYSVSGKTITVSCENTDGKCKEPDGGSVSLTVPADREYNGQQAEATYTGSLKTTDPVRISYATAEGQPLNDAPVDAGSYTACLHAGGKQVEDTFTISPRTVTVTAAACGKTYGDADPELTYAADGLLNDDSLTGELKRVAGENVGTYAIEQNTLSVDKNYTISFTGAELTIHAKPITEADVQLNGSLTYTGSEQTQAVTVADGITYEVTGNKATAAGSYELTVTGTGNFSGTVTRTFTIGKAAAAAVAPTAKELTYTGMAQNLVTAGTTNDGTMVYSLTENGQYTAEIPTGTNAGKYTVYYKVVGDANHSDTAVASVEVTIAKAVPAIGTVSANVVNDTLETSAIVLTREHTTVRGTLSVDDGQSLVWGSSDIRYTFTPADIANYEAVTGTVRVTVADTIAPTGTVSIAADSWAEFLNNITFGLLFKQTQSVSVVADDNLSGVDKIEYASADKAMTLDEVKAITDWTEYTDSFGVSVEDAKKFVYFIRITDKAGNVAYLSTDGAEYDTTAPVIEGVENGKTYYTTQKVTVTDKNLDTVSVNGTPVFDPTDFSLLGNTDVEYVVTAADKVGNTTTVTVTMKPIKEMVKTTENLDSDNVTSDDAPALEELAEELDKWIADPDTSDDGERETLQQHKVIVDSLLQAIEDAAKAADTEATQKVEDVTAENVKPEDKEALEDAKADFEKALEENSGNYTEDEKKAIQEDIDRIESAITALENVENVTEAIAQLPESVEPDDEAEAEKILAAKEAYDALTEHEKSLVGEDAQKKLEDLTAALTAYEIVAGDGSSWTKGGNTGLTFTANGAFSKFVGIKVDGVDVDKADYEAKAGSTIITLKASYLDTLKVGEHTITVVYNDGSTDGTFKIVAKPNTPAATGDDFNIALYGSLMAVSVSALVVLLLVSKKRKYAK